MHDCLHCLPVSFSTGILYFHKTSLMNISLMIKVYYTHSSEASVVYSVRIKTNLIKITLIILKTATEANVQHFCFL